MFHWRKQNIFLILILTLIPFFLLFSGSQVQAYTFTCDSQDCGLDNDNERWTCKDSSILGDCPEGWAKFCAIDTGGKACVPDQWYHWECDQGTYS